MTSEPAVSETPTLAPVLVGGVTLSRSFRLSAWLTLVKLSVDQLVRGRRLLALAFLFALPTLLTLLARWADPEFATKTERTEELILFYMIPQALVPLTALLLASGMVRDEVENQTITYLLIRPLPRPSIYLAKLIAAWTVASALTAVFATTALAAIYWDTPGFWGDILPMRAVKIALLSALSLLVYTTIFGAVSLFVKWVLPLGVAYIIIFEGAAANIDFMVRRLTVLWYVRVLAERWLGLHVEAWSIDLAESPSGTEALLTLLVTSFVVGIASAIIFGAREIRVKTPEGS